MGKVVQGEATGVIGADGAKVGYEISRIRTTHDLETKLKIDANASYAAGPFANVSARFDFAADLKIQTTSLFMAITSHINLATHSIDDPSLSPAAAAMVDNPTNFATRFGDMFVRGIGRGGLFVAVLQIDTSDSKSSEDISTELSGAYGLFSADAKVKFDKVQSDFHSDLSIKVYHEGGPIDLIPGNIDDPVQLYAMLQTWLKSFVDSPDKMAVPYSVILSPVAIANGPLPLNAADAEHAQDVLLECAKQRSAIHDSMNLMDAIIQTPGRFSFTAPVTMADIRAASSGYQADLDIVAAAASAAMNHPGGAKMPAAFAAATNQKFPQGIPPTPMPELDRGLVGVYAARGQRIASADPLLSAMRDLQPEGPARTGFEIGVAIGDDDTLWGPGKQRDIDNLPVTERGTADTSAHFIVDRNATAEFGVKGVAIAKNETRPEVVAARKAELPGYYTLGFDVATGMFGNKTLGGAAHTAEGPGSAKMRDSLHAEGIRGFKTALAIYMGK